jgi:hypothetical protein
MKSAHSPVGAFIGTPQSGMASPIAEPCGECASHLGHGIRKTIVSRAATAARASATALLI